MTMFGTIVQRLTSPMTSPSSCRRFKPSPRWEIQSDPEDDSIVPVRKSHAKDFLNKRRSKSHARCLNVSDPEPCENVLTWQDIAFPHLCETKSLGRLDGIREVQRLVDYECYLREAKNLIEDENQVETNSILQSNQLEGDLHRIQELFPGDNLRLHERDILTTIDPNYVCWLTRTEGMYVDTQTITVTGQNIKLPGSWVIADEFRRNRLIQNVLDEWRHYGPQKIGGFVVDNKLRMTTTENRVVNIGQHNQIYYSPTNFRLAKRKIYKYFEKNTKYPWEYCTGGVFGVYGFSHRLSHFRQHPHLPFVVDEKLFELQSIYCTQTPPQELEILEINDEDFL